MQADLRDLIAHRLNQLAPDTIFSLETLLLDAWASVGTGKERRSLGGAFSRAVRRGEFPQCVAVGLIGTDRDAKYRRVG